MSYLHPLLLKTLNLHLHPLLWFVMIAILFVQAVGIYDCVAELGWCLCSLLPV